MIAAENDELLLSSLRGPPGERTGRAPGQRAVGGHDAPPPQLTGPGELATQVCETRHLPGPGGPGSWWLEPRLHWSLQPRRDR